jgi:hypothetical protein
MKLNAMKLPALRSKGRETAKSLRLDPKSAITLVNKAILKRPAIVTELVKASRLVFSDSCYNITEKELCQYFRDTGAQEGFATIFIPSAFYEKAGYGDSEIYNLEEKPNIPDIRGFLDNCLPEFVVLLSALNMVPGGSEAWETYGDKTLLDVLIRKFHNYIVSWASNSFDHFVDWIVGLAQNSHPFEAFFGLDVLSFKVTYLLKAWLNRLKDYLKRRFLNTVVTWKNGYSNGYSHNSHEWKKWATQRVYQDNEIRIASEVISRYGEMNIIRFWRCDRNDTIVHAPAPPKHLETMRIWDWNATIKNSPLFSQGIVNPIWTTCLVTDFYEVYSWAIAEPSESLDFSVVATACNRTRRGLSLVSNVTHKGLSVRDAALSNFALNVYLQVHRDLNIIQDVEEAKKVWTSDVTIFERVLRTVASGLLILATGGLVIPAKAILAWLMTKEQRHEFVEKRPAPETIIERIRTKTKVERLPEQTVDIVLETIQEDPASSCLVCSLIRDGDVTGQTFVADRCTHDAKEISFGMDLSACAAARSLVSESIDFHRPFVGGASLDGARKFESFISTGMSTGLEHSATFHYILGGPGTGKSFIARALMYKLETMGYSTLMYLPLANLKADYDKATMSDGKMHKFAADTWFSTSRTGNIDILFVDEFTLVDSVHFQAYVNYAKPKHIFLVGDEKQQHKSPDVSVNPGLAEASYWRDIRDSCSVHELQRNFRFKGKGAAFRVKWLNKKFGYRMYTMETDMSGFEHVSRDAYLHMQEKPAEHFVFAHETSQTCFGTPSGPGQAQENHSVYASQGRTVETSAIAVFDADVAGFGRHGSIIVALTRSKEMPLLIEHTANSDVFTDFILQSGIKDDLSQEVWPTVKSPVASLEALTPERKLVNDKLLTVDLKPIDPMTEEPKTKIVFETTEPEKKMMDLAVLEWVLPFFETCTYDALPFEHRIDYLREVFWPIAEKSPYMTRAPDGSWEWTGPKKIKHRPDKSRYIEWLESRGIAFVEVEGSKKERKVKVHTGLQDPYDLVLYFTTSHVERKEKSWLPKIKISRDPERPQNWEYLDLWLVSPTGRTYGEYFYGPDYVQVAPGVGATQPDWRNLGSCAPRLKSYNSKLGERQRQPPSIKRVLNPDIPSEFTTFAACPKSQWIDNSKEVEKRFLSEPRHKGKIRFGKDNYRFAHLIDGSGGVGSVGLTRPSALGATLPPPRDFKDNFSLNFSNTFFARTKGGKITRKERDAQRSLLPGAGNTFTGGVNETLRGLQRVCGQRPGKGLSAEGFEFFQQSMIEAHRACHQAVAIEQLDVDRVLHNFWKDADTRNYLGRAMAERKKHSNILLKRVTNKKQYKPPKDQKINNLKTAQTITTTSPYWNLMHGAAMRVVNLVFKKSLKPDVFYDSYEPASAFKDRLSKAVQALPAGVQYGIVDGEEFDAGQTHGTMVAEMIHRRLSSINEQFVQSYYRIRQPGRFVFSGICGGRTDYEKGSGFSDTLLGNTTLEQMVGHNAILGEGPRVLALKGDDFLKVQFNLRRNDDFVKKLERYSNLKLKVDISTKGGEFIGCTIGKEGMYTSIPRVALKAVGASFRSYKHFTEYQKSLREAIKEMKDQGLTETMIANAASMNISISTVETCFAIAESISHCNEETFERHFKKRKDQMPPLPKFDQGIDMYTFNTFSH